MKVLSTTSPVQEAAVDAVVVSLFAESPLAGPALQLDQALGGWLTRLIESKDLSGKANETVILPVPAGIAAKAAAVVGLGNRDTFDAGAAYRACAAASKLLAGKKREKVAFYLGDGIASELQAAGIAGAMNGCIGQDLYRAKKSRFPFEEIGWNRASDAVLERGVILGESIAFARRLVNEPAGHIYPETFAAEAQRACEGTGIECEIWDHARLVQERCGSLLAVAQGSERQARLVIMNYRGGAKDEAPLALVGKGVTFDSGGLSLKPTDGMKTMKCDMAGAATVLATMQAIARLKLPRNVIGLCGMVENMVSGNSFKLGDVLTARSGKTIEVLNTDAEGRLVLADVLDVAIERGASRIVDLATLTGACLVALGTDIVGVMSNNEAWQAQVLAAAKQSGEACWPLPMFPEFSEQIRSEVADIKNTGDGRWGGTITAAKFLEEFVQEKPWVHLDIAGPAFYDNAKLWQDGGGTGTMVRTLVNLIEKSTTS